MKKPDYDFKVLKKIQRGKIYRVTWLKHPELVTISYLSHFYKRGVRLWILSSSKEFSHPIDRPYMRQLYMRTIDYVDLDWFTFEEIPATDLPLHISNATPLMEKYLKDKYSK